MLNYIKPFRFWCQKVLPLVYDDSLSYYELLCKVVDYLNHTTQDINEIIVLMEEFRKEFQEIYSQIEDDVRKILDEWLEDGTLADIITDEVIPRKQNIFVDNRPGTSDEAGNAIIKTAISYIGKKVYYPAETPHVTAITTRSQMQNVIHDGEIYYAIDCSTLVFLCLMGVDYDHSRYVNPEMLSAEMKNGAPWAENLWLGKGFKTITPPSGVSYQEYRRYTTDLFEVMAQNGCMYEINAKRDNLKPGDIIFWTQNESTEHGSWYGAKHCSIYIGRDNDGALRVIDSREIEGEPNFNTVNIYRITEQVFEENTIKYAARPSYNGWIPYIGENIAPKVTDSSAYTKRLVNGSNNPAGYYTILAWADDITEMYVTGATDKSNFIEYANGIFKHTVRTTLDPAAIEININGTNITHVAAYAGDVFPTLEKIDTVQPTAIYSSDPFTMATDASWVPLKLKYAGRRVTYNYQLVNDEENNLYGVILPKGLYKITARTTKLLGSHYSIAHAAPDGTNVVIPGSNDITNVNGSFTIIFNNTEMQRLIGVRARDSGGTQIIIDNLIIEPIEA